MNEEVKDKHELRLFVDSIPELLSSGQLRQFIQQEWKYEAAEIQGFIADLTTFQSRVYQGLDNLAKTYFDTDRNVSFEDFVDLLMSCINSLYQKQLINATQFDALIQAFDLNINHVDIVRNTKVKYVLSVPELISPGQIDQIKTELYSVKCVEVAAAISQDHQLLNKIGDALTQLLKKVSFVEFHSADALLPNFFLTLVFIIFKKQLIDRSQLIRFVFIVKKAFAKQIREKLQARDIVSLQDLTTMIQDCNTLVDAVDNMKNSTKLHLHEDKQTGAYRPYFNYVLMIRVGLIEEVNKIGQAQDQTQAQVSQSSGSADVQRRTNGKLGGDVDSAQADNAQMVRMPDWIGQLIALNDFFEKVKIQILGSRTTEHKYMAVELAVKKAIRDRIIVLIENEINRNRVNLEPYQVYLLRLESRGVIDHVTSEDLEEQVEKKAQEVAADRQQAQMTRA